MSLCSLLPGMKAKCGFLPVLSDLWFLTEFIRTILRSGMVELGLHLVSRFSTRNQRDDMDMKSD